jgi:hypothetical protein
MPYLHRNGGVTTSPQQEFTLSYAITLLHRRLGVWPPGRLGTWAASCLASWLAGWLDGWVTVLTSLDVSLWWSEVEALLRHLCSFLPLTSLFVPFSVILSRLFPATSLSYYPAWIEGFSNMSKVQDIRPLRHWWNYAQPPSVLLWRMAKA